MTMTKNSSSSLQELRDEDLETIVGGASKTPKHETEDTLVGGESDNQTSGHGSHGSHGGSSSSGGRDGGDDDDRRPARGGGQGGGQGGGHSAPDDDDDNDKPPREDAVEAEEPDEGLNEEPEETETDAAGNPGSSDPFDGCPFNDPDYGSAVGRASHDAFRTALETGSTPQDAFQAAQEAFVSAATQAGYHSVVVSGAASDAQTAFASAIAAGATAPAAFMSALEAGEDGLNL